MKSVHIDYDISLYMYQKIISGQMDVDDPVSRAFDLCLKLLDDYIELFMRVKLKEDQLIAQSEFIDNSIETLGEILHDHVNKNIFTKRSFILQVLSMKWLICCARKIGRTIEQPDLLIPKAISRAYESRLSADVIIRTAVGLLGDDVNVIRMLVDNAQDRPSVERCLIEMSKKSDRVASSIYQLEIGGRLN